MLSAADIAKMRDQQEDAMPDSMTIKRPTKTANAIGGANESITDLGPYPCRLMGVSGREAIISDQVEAEATAVLTYPTAIVLHETDSVVIAGILYAVVHIEDAESWQTAGRAQLVRR